MTRDAFAALIAEVTGRIAGRPLDAALGAWLNAAYPAGSPQYQALADACRQGQAEGFVCEREAGGIKYGRVLKPTPATDGFSVDVVEMDNIAGPHHTHPNGEIDLVMPLEGDAKFDGHGAGWCVYGAGSAHIPTVTGGRAYVLYLLPQGAIEFTRG